MRITQWGEYGIHLSAYIAQQQSETGAPVPANDIAKSQSIAADYAHQILQRLRKGGIIESVRGPLGGYRLTRPPEQITLLDILVAAEGESFEIICDNRPIGNERCSPNGNCSLRGLWHDLKDHIDSFLKKETLRSLSQREPLASMPVQIGEKAAV